MTRKADVPQVAPRRAAVNHPGRIRRPSAVNGAMTGKQIGLGRDRPTRAPRRASLVDEIIDAFKRDIIASRMRPGQRVPSEFDLAERFQVSRGAVREAMKTLQAIGVVTIRRGNGTYIVERPSESLLNPLVFAVLLEAARPAELVELRLLFEVGYCQLVAGAVTPDDWVVIEAAQQRFEALAAIPDSDVEMLTRLDLEFHYCLLDATHNPLVRKIGRSVEELYHNTIRITHLTDRGRDTGVVGHRQIMAAIRGADPETIRAEVRQALSYWASETGREDPEASAGAVDR